MHMKKVIVIICLVLSYCSVKPSETSSTKSFIKFNNKYKGFFADTFSSTARDNNQPIVILDFVNNTANNIHVSVTNNQTNYILHDVQPDGDNYDIAIYIDKMTSSITQKIYFTTIGSSVKETNLLFMTNNTDGYILTN